jgi:hypothetical protein
MQTKFASRPDLILAIRYPNPYCRDCGHIKIAVHYVDILAAMAVADSIAISEIIE